MYSINKINCEKNKRFTVKQNEPGLFTLPPAIPIYWLVRHQTIVLELLMLASTQNNQETSIYWLCVFVWAASVYWSMVPQFLRALPVALIRSRSRYCWTFHGLSRHWKLLPKKKIAASSRGQIHKEKNDDRSLSYFHSRYSYSLNRKS